MDVGSLLVTDAEAAELIDPGECSFHHPAPLPQAATVPRVALCQERSNTTVPQTSPNCCCIVGTITKKAVGTTARSSTLS